MIGRRWRGLSAGMAAVALAACNFAPHYDPPSMPSPAAFKEAVPGGDATQGWKVAEPRDSISGSAWWQVYGDPELDVLEDRVAVSNQTILAAAASYRAAYALVQEAEAQLLPTLSLAPSVTREKSSAALSSVGGGVTTAVGGATTTGATTEVTQSVSTRPHNVVSLPLEASYQIDLWGSIRNTVAENRFAATASAAQLANALLSTQSTLAADYFQLRVADEQRRILDSTVADYRASLNLVKALVSSGVDSEADVATAETQLDSALAAATDVGVARAQYEHAIAVLIGVAPASLSIPYRHFDPTLPTIPVGLPSDLLERRPDIAAAERQVAETNAQIGVARAAFFPTLTLSASAGYESTAISNLFNAPNRVWSLGPSLAQTLFAGGARRAAVAQARALNEAQAATYRAAVLAAFESVEDNLASLRILGAELGQAHKATVAAQRALTLTLVLFKNGVDSYINVISAQNSYLNARETELGVQLKQLTASVSLVNDLGGGWDAAQLPQTERAARTAPSRAAAAAGPASEGSPVANPPAIPADDITPLAPTP